MEEAAFDLRKSDGGPRWKARYLEAAREYYSLQRKDGALTVYDEQKIANDLAAHTPGPVVSVSGDYIHSTQISYRPDPDGLLTAPESVQSAILQAIRMSERIQGEGASLSFIHERVKASRSLIREQLDLLQLEGMVEIGNREDGVIVFRINDLDSSSL